MYTLTDLFIDQGLCKPIKTMFVLDGGPDDPRHVVLDGEEPQKEEKDRE